MKKILLFTIATLMLVACKSNEQRISEDYLKQHMNCPSTLKVVEFTKEYVPKSEKRDTLYRISKVKGTKIWDGSYPKESAKVVYIDSVRESVTTIYAHTVCHLAFDAQNLMGATIRNNATIVLDFDKIPYFYEQWDDMVNSSAKLQPAWSESLMVSEYGLLAPLYFRNGDWVNKRLLCKYGQSGVPVR